MRLQSNLQPTCTFIGVLSLVLSCFLTPSAGLAQLTPPNLQADDKVDAVNIRITRFGPYPASITHGPGPFLLFISNRSGALADTYSLLLKPGARASSATPATSVLDLHSTPTQHRDHEMIKLLPGDYELRFLSHPDWVVSTTITAN